MALAGNEMNNIQEILLQAIPNGESMLSELLGQTTNVTLGTIDSVDAASLGTSLPGSNLLAPVELSDGAGAIVFAVAENQGAIMADLMIGQDGSNPPTVLEDLHLSAVTELTSQFTDAVVSSISSQVSKGMMTTPGEVSVVDLDAGLVPGVDGEVIIVEAEMKIGEFDAGKMGIVFSGEIAELLKNGPQAEASADGFVGDATAGASTPAAATAQAQNVVSSELSAERTSGTIYEESLDLVLDVPLNVTVELGRTDKLVREVLDMSPGSVIELDKLAGEPVDILVNQKHIAKGEVVVIDENFGIRITDIIRPADRIPKI